MVYKTVVDAGIIGVLLLLAGVGGSLVLNKGQFDHAYVCSTSECVGIFDSLSSTAKTGYYLDTAGVKRSSVCTNGVWVKLEKYAVDHGLDPSSFMQAKLQESQGSFEVFRQFKCDQVQCVEVT